jgi:hypothetical protein
MLLNLGASPGPPWPCPATPPSSMHHSDVAPTHTFWMISSGPCSACPPDDLQHLRTALILNLHSYQNSLCLPLHQTVLRYSYNGMVQEHLRWVHVWRVHPLRHTPPVRPGTPSPVSNVLQSYPGPLRHKVRLHTLTRTHVNHVSLAY